MASHAQGQGGPNQQQQEHYQQYQLYKQPSSTYGNYGEYFQQNVFQCNAWQAFQFNSQDDLWQVFKTEMSKNPVNVNRQAIQAEDLMNILNNCATIRNYFKINWNRELCCIMLAMLDRSKDGFIQWNEFMELQQCLVAWFNVFCQYDTNRTGYIESYELGSVVNNSFGYNLTPESVETLLKRYSRVTPVRGQVKCLIAFDDFVAVSVRLRAYTDVFRARDIVQHGGDTGKYTFMYDDFLRCVMRM